MKTLSISRLLSLFWGLALCLASLPLASASAHPAASDPAASRASAEAPSALASQPDVVPSSFFLLPSSILSGTALITAIDTQSFPGISVNLAVDDAAGRHVSQLPASAFALAENAQPLPAPGLSVSEKEVGLQVVFAVDTSAPFKTRDAAAVTRLDYIKQALTAFGSQAAPRLKDGVDDVTLLTPESKLLVHTSQGSDLVRALAAYTTTFAGAADPLPLVNQALDFVSETMPRPGMPRYIVLFSNGLVINGKAAPLGDVVARAQSAHVAIYTVYVGLPGASDLIGGQSLRQLAKLTQGDFLVLEKPESLKPLLQHLADQRLQYQISYRSTISVTGQHTLSATVTLPDGNSVVSNPASFPLRVEPPVISLAALPSVIQLSQPSSAGATLPYTVPVTLDFPDGHPRQLRTLELLVDGKTVDTQPASPLIWDLGEYKENGAHTLQARAVDELGLTGESAPLNLTLSFSAPPPPATPTAAPVVVVPIPAVATPASAALPNRWLLIGGILLCVGVLVVGGIWFVQSRTARPERPGHTRPIRPPAASRADGDSTQPPVKLPASMFPPSRPAPARAPAFPFFPKKKAPAPSKPLGKAYLEILEGGSGPREAIEIYVPTLRLGRDATRAEAVFQDRSVSRLHARITEAPEGVFRLYDEGSTSGTWVNFTQIPAEGGWELKPGDVINLGRVQLRFKRRGAPPAPDRPSPRPPAPPSGTPAGGDGETEPYHPVKK